MKIILTGATGFVGSHVLAHLIADPHITGVTCISRRPVASDSPKVTTILQDDFLSYGPALFDRLAEHDACIWALGGKASDLGEPEAFARITHDFTLALAEGIAGRARGTFTFCYLSGMGADPTETAKLPWEKLTRHFKGRTEKDLFVLQQRNPVFCTHAFRPGGILPDHANRLLRFGLAPIVVSVGELSEAMIAGAVDKRLFRQWPVIGNGDIKRLAKHRLPARSR
ncbi:MAG TPA: NAD-dependent epimerase/dehydratase family protein [Rhodopseudomonas sp.]|uniref:NAD-dependent epimerase/dehydratase family protein n=1 Tax=Rhodopseudomonas sp. TaxID=1078 RepID=UPI002ED7E4B2